MATENAVMTYNDAGYQLPLTISGSGNYNYLLRTKDTYLNKDITITTSTAAAVSAADNANADVTLFTTDGSNAGVNISAIVGTKATTEPTSGYYLAFKGSGRSKITNAGWIGTGALNTSTSDAKYFPIAVKTVSFGGQTLTNTNYSKTDLAVSFASGSDTNMSNITYGAKDTTNYPFYYKISGSTPAVSGTTTVSIGAVTYSNDLGLVEAHSGATALNATSSSPTVSVNAGAGSTYIKIKKITVGTKISSGSAGTVTPVIKRTALPSGDTWTDAASGAEVATKPTSGVYVQVDAAAIAKSLSVQGTVTSAGYGTADNGSTDGTYTKATAQSITAGSAAAASKWIPIQTGSAAVTASQSITKNPDISFPASGTLRATYSGSKSITGTVSTAGWITSVTAATVTTSGTKDVTSLTLPATYNFTLTTTAGASGDNTGFTITNNAYRKITITNNANGTTTVTNSGTVTVTNSGTTTVTSGIASSTPKGTINVNAYPASGTTLDGSKKIVENGRWITTSVSAGGTYYGKVTIGTASFNNTATSGVSYADYDTNAPIIPSGGYLYINAGYTPARKISLAKLVPNEVTVGETVEDPLIHPNCTAYNVKGEVVVGTMVIYDGAYTITT